MRRFKLERESLHNALRSGQTLDEITSMLEEHSGRPLPANVSRTLKDWAGQFGRIEVLKNYDLLEFESLEKRDYYLKQYPQAEGVGECFALNPAELHKGHPKIIDYDLPPPACVTILEKGRLIIDKNQGDLTVENEVSRYASRVSTGTYEITQSSVSQSPLPPREIVAHLKTRSQTPVPADLITSVYGWAKAIPPLPMGTVCILQVEDENVRLGLRARPEIQKYIAGQLSPSFFIVEKGSLDKLKSALLEMGISTTDSLAISSLSPTKSKAGKGLINTSDIIPLSGLTPFPPKQTRALLEKAIENKQDVEIFFENYSGDRLLYQVTPKEIQRYSNRPVLIADPHQAGSKSNLTFYIKDILALRIIE